MPDRGVPIGDPVNNAAHVATPQWQSFETRMRYRRAERCLQRASAAIEAGQLEEATEALDEARELNPRAPEIESLLERLAAMQAPHLEQDPAQPLADEVVVPAFVRTLKPPLTLDLDPLEPVDFHPLHTPEPVDPHPLHTSEALVQTSPRADSRSGLRAAAAGCVALGLSALAGWLVVTQWSARVPPSATRADISLPAAARESVIAEVDRLPVPDEPGLEAENIEEPAAPAEVKEELAAAAETPRPDSTREPVTPPRSELSPTDVESTSGTVPAPAVAAPTVPPPAPRLVPRVVEEAQRTAARSSAADGPAAPATVPTAGASSPAMTTVAPVPEPSPPAAADSPRAPTPSDSPPPPATLEVAPRPASAAVDDRAAVRATLSRYEAAYSDLDTAGARAVWPAVDQRALARAFEGLASQRVALGTCEVGVNGQSARAICVGNATWTPKVGGGQQTKSRTWTFDLRRADATWQIVKVDTR